MAKVLIVDSDAHWVHQVGHRLNMAGHRCKGATDGKTAKRLLESRPFDLVVLDMMLGGVSGFELCRFIRMQDQLYTMPVLFCSSMCDEAEVQHILAQGADDFVAKPTSLEVLTARVAGLLVTAGDSLQDAQTSLPGPKGTKLEVQRAVVRGVPFALAYIELLGMSHLARIGAPEGRSRVLRRFARRLMLTGEELANGAFRAGHMGGGHFVCMTAPQDVEVFCQRICQRWRAHRPDLFDALLRDNLVMSAVGREEVEQVSELLAPACFVTHFGGEGHETFRSLFDTVTRLRQMANGHAHGGIYPDRRGSWAPPRR